MPYHSAKFKGIPKEHFVGRVINLFSAILPVASISLFPQRKMPVPLTRDSFSVEFHELEGCVRGLAAISSGNFSAEFLALASVG